MNKLEKLIADQCPNGVRFKLFGEVATISRGASPRPIKAYITDSSDGINWIKIGDAFYYAGIFGEWCKANANKSGAVSIIGINKMKQFMFPLLPLKTQTKVVEQLDTMSLLYDKNVDLIKKEIEARQKQYEYYKAKLLTFPELKQ